MSLNCFWRPTILCASISLWIWAKNSATSTAASESWLQWAQTCEFCENLPDRHSSGVGKAVGSVRCYHMVCGLYGSLNPHTASLLLQRTRKLSLEEKHTVPTVSSVDTADPTFNKYQQVTGRAQIQETDLNPEGWWQVWSYNSLGL